jgi:hypothetical protein
MKHNRKLLLQDLKKRMQRIQQTVLHYQYIELELLNHKASPESWSALECLEHLNLYGDYYLPEMEKSILQGKTAKLETYTPGFLGDYFAKTMQVKPNGSLKRMKSPSDKIPASSRLGITTTDRFLKQTDHLLRLLDLAVTTDLQHSKTPISISKWVKLRLGDTFRFYVYHIERHIAQAERAIGREDKDR